MSELTKLEDAWIKRFKKCCKAAPKSLRFYVIDGGEIVICKDKISSGDFSEYAPINIGSGCVINDLHDELNNGNHDG